MLSLREEFSFPIITNNKITKLAPSLWRISSLEEYTTVVGCLDHQFEANGRKGFSTSSFSDLFEVEVENKMDLLWEDFNDDEEKLGSKVSLDHQEYYCEERDGDLVQDIATRDEFLCVQPNLRTGNTSTCGLVVSQKKTRMILVFKVLMKKLLLLHKMGRFKKFRS